MTIERESAGDVQAQGQIPVSALAALATTVLGAGSIDDTLRSVCTVTLEVVQRGDAASVTVLRGETLTTFGATDDLATAGDGCQHDARDGPSFEATRMNTPVVVSDLRLERRWSAAPCMADAGIGSAFSLPLNVPGRAVGTLNLYARAVGAFDDADVEVSTALASYAAIAVTNAVSYASAADLADHLQNAMRTRAVIEQAKGIVMSSTHCGADEAFRLLVQQSQHENRKLNEIAAELVALAQRKGTVH